jgi:hypothetical protein
MASVITTNADGDAVIELSHHDSITIEGLTGRQLQAYLHSCVHLH